MNNIVGTTSWISVVLILWGFITNIIEPKFTTWFAFLFFVITGILAFSWSIRKNK